MPGAGSSPVLVVGEALIDAVSDTDGAETRVPGGSPANVALGLARLGTPVALLTHLARDDDGRRIAHRLHNDGVRILPESFGAERTPVAHARIDRRGVRYVFDVRWSLPPSTAVATPRALHVGSYSAFLEPGATQVSELVDRVHARGGLVSFDPNIRPELLRDRSHAVARFRSLAARADVLKMSDEDARWLFPDVDLAELLRRLVGRGPRLAVITGGAEGSMLAVRNHTVSIRAAPARVVDTVGAGDSYMAALVHSVLHTEPGRLGTHELRRIGGYCAAAAAFTVGRRGADLPRSADLGVAPIWE